MELVVPPNATATVYIPAREGALVTEGDRLAADADGVKALGWENGAAIFSVVSGTYRFSAGQK